MTECELYDGVIVEGTTDLFFVISVLRRRGAAWCVIGGLAVNTYASPVYTADCDLIVAARDLTGVLADLQEANFAVKEHPHWTNARRRLRSGESDGHRLMVQFSREARYQDFPDRAAMKPVFGQDVPVAALADLVRGKVWAWSDAARRPTKRLKDALDLMRLAEVDPEIVIPLLPEALRAQAQEIRNSGGSPGVDEDSMGEQEEAL